VVATTAALQMALQPNLTSLDELLAAIRALQCQADQEIARLLERNAELLAAAERAELAFRVPAGTRPFDEVRALQMLRAAIANAKPKSSTRTYADVEDDARAIREEAGR
jgi:hypothetical protein